MKKTFVTKEKLEEITQQFPTPFHLYDEKESVRMCRNCTMLFPGTKDTKSFLQ